MPEMFWSIGKVARLSADGHGLIVGEAHYYKVWNDYFEIYDFWSSYAIKIDGINTWLLIVIICR